MYWKPAKRNLEKKNLHILLLGHIFDTLLVYLSYICFHKKRLAEVLGLCVCSEIVTAQKIPFITLESSQMYRWYMHFFICEFVFHFLTCGMSNY